LANLSKEFSNKRNALLVRIGEKKLIYLTLEAFKEMPIVAAAAAADNSNKRSANNTMQTNSKKQKQ
jgi:2-C-methyl-D-erythritol 4-phosphate cytidylyltransferase